MTHRVLTLTLALVAGFLGSSIARYMVPTAVFAEERTTNPEEIRAQRFTLVDENGKTRGVFAIAPDPTNDANGKAGGVAIIRLYDGSGREVFSAGPAEPRLIDQK